MKCKICGRPLKNKESERLQVGPTCRKKMDKIFKQDYTSLNSQQLLKWC